MSGVPRRGVLTFVGGFERFAVSEVYGRPGRTYASTDMSLLRRSSEYITGLSTAEQPQLPMSKSCGISDVLMHGPQLFSADFGVMQTCECDPLLASPATSAIVGVGGLVAAMSGGDPGLSDESVSTKGGGDWPGWCGSTYRASRDPSPYMLPGLRLHRRGTISKGPARPVWSRQWSLGNRRVPVSVGISWRRYLSLPSRLHSTLRCRQC
jgi:hypothetical protein